MGSGGHVRQPFRRFHHRRGWLVVADTNHGRLVVFDKDNRYLRTIDGPPAQVLPENFKYNPISVAVNAAGQFYVVSKNSNMGVMALDGDGGFQGFIGAQRVASNAASCCGAPL